MERKSTSTKTIEVHLCGFLGDACSEQEHEGIFNNQDDLSRFGVWTPVKKTTAAETSFHLLYDGILQFGRSEVIPSDEGPGSIREMVASFTEAEHILKRTSAPYHSRFMGQVNEQIRPFKRCRVRCLLQEDIDIPFYRFLDILTILCLELFSKAWSFEIVYGYLPGDSSTSERCNHRIYWNKNEVFEAMSEIIDEDYLSRQDQRCHQRLTWKSDCW